MFYSVSKKLYDLDSSIIVNMAKNNECLDVESTSAMLSYDAEKVKGHNITKNRTLDGKIYISSNFSAKKIITTIKQLLGKYNIEENEFYYSAMNKTGYVKSMVVKKTERVGGKYAPLGEYLLTVEEDEFVLDVEGLESILKFKLPNSFYKHVEFTTTSHNIGDVAYAAGFKTHRTKDDMEHVTFTRIGIE